MVTLNARWDVDVPSSESPEDQTDGERLPLGVRLARELPVTEVTDHVIHGVLGLDTAGGKHTKRGV